MSNGGSGGAVPVPDSSASLFAYERAVAASNSVVADEHEKWKAAHEASLNNHRLSQPIRDELAQIARILGAARAEAETWPGLIRRQNQQAFENAENPAEGIYKESKHDVGRD